MTNDRIGTEVKTLGGNDLWAQGQVFQTVEQFQATIASQAAEIERLREALKTIADDCEADYPPSHGAIKYFARAALQPKEGEG